MSAVKKLANAIYLDTTYLYNYTAETLAPGTVVAFDAQGDLRVLGMLWERMTSEEDRARAQAAISDVQYRRYNQTQLVQRGWQLGLSIDAAATGALPAAEGKISATISFGIGGGCFLDIVAAPRVMTVSTRAGERLWLLQQAAKLLPPKHLYVDEAVETPHVAGATSGWSASLKLAVDGSVDPSAVGMGSLAELLISSKLKIAAQNGRVWFKAETGGTPLFRAIAAANIVDILKVDTKLNGGADTVLDFPTPDTPMARTIRPATVDDVGSFYDFDDE